MKKLLFVAAVASAFGLFAGDESESAGTQVLEVGVTAITSPLKNTVIAISYESLKSDEVKGDEATIDHRVKAEHLVKTTNLELGDLLFAFEDGVYHSWTLEEVGEEEKVKVWVANQETDGDADEDGVSTPKDGKDPAKYPLAYGSGIWLCRQKVEDDEGKIIPFYIYGKPSDKTSIDVPAGTTVLVGNPTTSDKKPTIANAQPGDTILIPSATIPTQVKCVLDKTDPSGVKWGGVRISDIPKISANTGFWYISAVGGDTRTISW